MICIVKVRCFYSLLRIWKKRKTKLKSLCAYFSAVLKTVEDLRIDMILGERLDLATTRPENAKFNERGQRVVGTEKGREVAADVLVSSKCPSFFLSRQTV